MVSSAIRPLQAKVVCDYARIQAKHSVEDAGVGTEEETVTKMDRRLSSSYDMYKLASRLEDALKILEECVFVLNEKVSSLNMRKETSRCLKVLVRPLLSNAAQTAKTAAIEVAPMPGVDESYRKLEVKRKHEAVSVINECVKKTSVEHKRVVLYISKLAKQSSTCGISTPACKRQRRVLSPRIDDDADARPPPPKNGSEYTKSEAISHLASTKKFSKEIAEMMNYMIHNGYAPTTTRYLEKLLQKHDAG